MTQQTHEQEIGLGHFVIGFFDILGRAVSSASWVSLQETSTMKSG